MKLIETQTVQNKTLRLEGVFKKLCPAQIEPKMVTVTTNIHISHLCVGLTCRKQKKKQKKT